MCLGYSSKLLPKQDLEPLRHHETGEIIPHYLRTIVEIYLLEGPEASAILQALGVHVPDRVIERRALVHTEFCRWLPGRD